MRAKRDESTAARKDLFYELVPTSRGAVGIVWVKRKNNPSIIHIFHAAGGAATSGVISDEYPGAEPGSDRGLGTVANNIRRYMEGHDIGLSPALLDMDRCYDFQRKVLLKTFEIPRGRVASYGHIAHMIAAPGAARAVGTALARNPFPLVLPCHRVVKAGGHLGNFGGGTDMKRDLLRLEGVETTAGGRIAPHYYWQDRE